MEKLVAGPKAKGVLDLNLSIADNIHAVAKALDKPLSELTIVTLAKPRHDQVIKQIHAMGCKVFALPDGDVAASILACMPQSEVDMMYCIGGAPEGVISAAVVRALGGDMQGRLLLRSEAKGASAENDQQSALELERCQSMGVQPGVVLSLNDMAKSDNVVFSATGVTKGDLLEGVQRDGDIATTETLLIRGRSRTIRKIQSQHYLSRKDDEIKKVVY